jgi:hypothetical protein
MCKSHYQLDWERRRTASIQCSIAGCENGVKSASLCAKHGWRLRHHGDANWEPPAKREGCTVPGCSGTHKAYGLCRKHAAQREAGTPVGANLPTRIGTLAERFTRFLTPGAPDDCWEWRGNRNNRGYGKLGKIYAHRVAYELASGPIPSGLEVMHSCDNPPCCNPAHLSVGTHADNMQDMARKGRHPWARTV